MTAPAAGAVLQQALTNLGNEAHADADAVGAFAAAGGGLPADDVAAAVAAATAPLTASIAAMQASQNNMQAQLNAMQNNMQARMNTLEGHVIAARSMAARAWNATCNDGISRPYVPVPNDAGATAPPGVPAVGNMIELLALNGPQLNAWCDLYGVVPAADLHERRVQLAESLGVRPPPPPL